MVGPSASRLIFLRQSADIERVKKFGRRRQTSLFTMLAFPSGLPDLRIGVVVGKRFGVAVKRNRAKRRFRELARQRQAELNGGLDVLIYPRRAVLTVRYSILREAWEKAFAEEGIMRRLNTAVCDPSAFH